MYSLSALGGGLPRAALRGYRLGGYLAAPLLHKGVAPRGRHRVLCTSAPAGSWASYEGALSHRLHKQGSGPAISRHVVGCLGVIPVSCSNHSAQACSRLPPMLVGGVLGIAGRAQDRLPSQAHVCHDPGMEGTPLLFTSATVGGITLRVAVKSVKSPHTLSAMSLASRLQSSSFPTFLQKVSGTQVHRTHSGR